MPTASTVSITVCPAWLILTLGLTHGSATAEWVWVWVSEWASAWVGAPLGAWASVLALAWAGVLLGSALAVWAWAGEADSAFLMPAWAITPGDIHTSDMATITMVGTDTA